MSEQNTSSAPIDGAQTSEAIEDNSTESTQNQSSSESNRADTSKLAELQSKPKSQLTKSEKKTLKELRLKIDGEEVVEKLPFELPEDAAEYMRRELQLAKMGQKRAQQHAELQKQVNGFIEELRKNPKKLLSDPNIGIDLKELAAQVIEEEIEKSKKSPEQLEKEKLEQKLREIEEERQKEKEALQKKEFELIQNQAYEEYDRQISQAIEGSSLPKSPYIVKKVADYMLMGLQEGLDINASDVLPLVEDEMKNDLKQMFAVLPEDVIENLIGKDVISRMRKKNVAKAKAAAIPSSKALDVGMKKEVDQKPIKKMTIRDYLKV